MALIEREILRETTDFRVNPYGLHPESAVVRNMTSLLVESRTPFMDRVSNPDIADDNYTFAVYLLTGDDEYSDIARSVEGHVLGTDFLTSPEEVQEGSKAVERNSIFFLVVDVTNVNEPKPSSSLSVADCLIGPSETMQNYVEKFGSESVPTDLTVTIEDQERGLWDVMAVMSPINYRKSKAAIWAYSALHQASQMARVHRWIASMTDKEFGSIAGMGIPFKVIEGTKDKKIAVPRPGKSTIYMGFHTIDVDEIIGSMTQTIAQLECAAKEDTNKEIDWQAIADIAHIAMDGTVSRSRR